MISIFLVLGRLKNSSMFRKLKTYNFIFIFIIIIGIFYNLFSEKGIVNLLKNDEIISKKQILLSQKKGIKNDLEIRISSFMDSEVYKELILKEKLFLKNDNDKVIFYELDN